jgi:hypothetical protein
MEVEPLSQPVPDGGVGRARIQEEPERAGIVNPRRHHNRTVLVDVESNDIGIAVGHDGWG